MKGHLPDGRAKACLLASVAFVTLGGCVMFPKAGPSSHDVIAGQTACGEPTDTPSAFQLTAAEDTANYQVVRVTARVASVLRRAGQPTFAQAFTDRRPAPEIRFGVGDVLGIAIFEAAAGGLFIPAEAGARPGNFISLPAQSVDRQGNITVPYAGAVPAAGRTAREVEDAIEERLKNRAIEPQVVITLQNQLSSQISVLGEVNTPQRLAANPAGDRVLDVVARAGGPKNQNYESFITLQRSGRTATVYLDNLVNDPRNNIFVRPNDTIYVSRDFRTFVALGASGRAGRFPFEAAEISLAEAVGKAAGLLDSQANPSAVFLYRLERRDVLTRMGLNTLCRGKEVPVIYHINLREPDGYFFAKQLPINDKDLLYVDNAVAVDMLKFINFIRSGLAVVTDATIAVRGLQNEGSAAVVVTPPPISQPSAPIAAP